MATCLNRELILFPSITRPGLFPPTGWENPATASPVIRHQWQWRWRRWWHQLQGKHFPLNSLLPVHDDIDINTTTMCKYLGQSSIDAPIRVVTSRGSELSHRSSRGADWSNSPVIVFTLSSSIVSYPWITLCSQWVYLSTIDGFNWYSNELICQRSMDHNEFNLSTIHQRITCRMAKVDCSLFLVPCQHPDLKFTMIATIWMIMKIMTMVMRVMKMMMRMMRIVMSFTLMPACFRSLTVSTTWKPILKCFWFTFS